jgi:DNA integrity scanning protein DisA with diadenylate cyclase activity
LFKAIQSRLGYDLLLLAIDMVKIFDGEISDILEQIGSSIEMLRGTEAQVLAKNGDFLERLRRAVTGALKEMENIEEVAEQAKREAEKDGYY